MLGRIDGGLVQLLDGVPRDGVEAADADNLVPVQLDAVGLVVLHIGRIHLQHVPPDAEFSPVQDGVVALVLQADELAGKGGGIQLLPLLQMNPHVLVQVRHSQSVDAGHGGHYNHVPPLHEAVGGGKP